MKTYLYACGAILCWASLPAATGTGLSGLSTEELLFYSFSCAALFLYVQDVILSGSFSLFIPDLRSCLLGVWGIFVYHYTYYTALKYAPLAEGAILTTTWSFWIVIFSSVILLRRLDLSIALTALVGMVGAGLVISSGKNLSFAGKHAEGYLLALACGLIWSSFSVGLSRMHFNKEPMTAFTIFSALLSALVYLVTLPHSLPPLRAALAAVYLGCVPLGLSFFFWNRAVNGGNMVVIGFLSYLTPPLAVLLVAMVHNEAVAGQVLVGMGVIVGASICGRFSLSRSMAIKALRKQIQPSGDV